MKTIAAQEVFSHMTPSTLADFILDLPDDLHPNCATCAIIAELNAMAYSELVANVGEQEANELLAELKPC